MALSHAVITELQAEREALLFKRQAIDERLAAVDLLLRGTRAAAKHPLPQKAHRPALTPAPELLLTKATGMKGFRAAIEGVLKQAPTGAGDVIRALEGQFRPEGKTPLSTRVYNELKRLKDEGRATRDQEGKYRLLV